MQHPYYQSPAVIRSDILSTDAAIREITAQFRRGVLTQSAAIDGLRDVGACEPEIVDLIA